MKITTTAAVVAVVLAVGCCINLPRRSNLVDRLSLNSRPRGHVLGRLVVQLC